MLKNNTFSALFWSPEGSRQAGRGARICETRLLWYVINPSSAGPGYMQDLGLVIKSRQMQHQRVHCWLQNNIFPSHFLCAMVIPNTFPQNITNPVAFNGYDSLNCFTVHWVKLFGMWNGLPAPVYCMTSYLVGALVTWVLLVVFCSHCSFSVFRSISDTQVIHPGLNPRLLISP